MQLQLQGGQITSFWQKNSREGFRFPWPD